MSYTHLTLEERKYLQKLLSEGYSQRKIAAILERSPSTISREIQRNRAKWKPQQKPDNPYWYNHWRAHNLYIPRRREQQRMALHPGTEAWEFIIAGLKQYWSPEAIAGRWHLEYPERKPLCVSTVYRYIKKSLFPKITPKTHLRRRGKRIQTRNANYNQHSAGTHHPPVVGRNTPAGKNRRLGGRHGVRRRRKGISCNAGRS